MLSGHGEKIRQICLYTAGSLAAVLVAFAITACLSGRSCGRNFLAVLVF
jgi:hypothetical protein